MSIIREIENVVTPVDFSDNSKLIAESSAYMAGKFGAAMYLVFVLQNFEDYSEKKMASFCEDLEEFCKKAGVASVNYKVLKGDVGEKIVEYAAEVGADMIVMGTHVVLRIRSFDLRHVL